MLAVVEQFPIVVVVVQANTVRVVDIVLRRTQEERFVASVVEAAKAVPAASRQRRKPEGVLVGDAAMRPPTSLGLQLGTRRRRNAHGREQGSPFIIAGQMPALGADAPHQSR